MPWASAPILDALGEAVRVQFGPKAEQVIPRGLRVRADVIPQRRVIGPRIKAMSGQELLVELVRPGPAARPVERGLVEKGRVNGRAEMGGEPVVVGLVRDFDEPVGGLADPGNRRWDRRPSRKQTP